MKPIPWGFEVIVSCNGFIKEMLVDWILNRFEEQAAKKQLYQGQNIHYHRQSIACCLTSRD